MLCKNFVVVLYIMSKCCNVDKVYTNFNKMADGRHFTDFRPHHEMDIHLFKDINGVCNNNQNSYDMRICLQRNTGNVFNKILGDLETIYNVPRCSK